jgi:hypothetical protein
MLDNIDEINMLFHTLGKFRHLPVVENGELIAMLDIAKCLYDAISRLEKAAEQGNAIAAAVEGVESQLGGNLSGFLLHNLYCQLIYSFFRCIQISNPYHIVYQ